MSIITVTAIILNIYYSIDDYIIISFYILLFAYFIFIECRYTYLFIIFSYNFIYSIYFLYSHNDYISFIYKNITMAIMTTTAIITATMSVTIITYSGFTYPVAVLSGHLIGREPVFCQSTSTSITVTADFSCSNYKSNSKDQD